MDSGGNDLATDALRGDDSRARLTKRLGVSSFVAAVAAGVALYAWTQISSTTPTAAGMPVFPTLAPVGGGGPGSGEMAPSFTVPTLDGGSFSLDDHLENDGRPVFLNLWASWCIPCRQEMPAIDAVATRHPGVLFVGVAINDTFAKAAEFAEEVGVTYTLGVDVDGHVVSQYPIIGRPATFIISPEGVVLKRVYGLQREDQIDADLATFFGG